MQFQSLLRLLPILAIATMFAGCTILAERGNPGGYADQQMDRVFPASSPQMRLLRAYFVQASLVRLASFSGTSSMRRVGFSNMVIAANDRFGEVAECAIKTDIVDKSDHGPKGCFYFDSIMIDYENALFDMAIFVINAKSGEDLSNNLMAGPNSLLLSNYIGSFSPKRFISEVTGSVTSVITTGNPLDIIENLLLISKEAYIAGRPMGALYRDSQLFLKRRNITGSPENEYQPVQADFLEIHAMQEFFCQHLGLSKDDDENSQLSLCQKKPSVIQKFPPGEVEMAKTAKVIPFVRAKTRLASRRE